MQTTLPAPTASGSFTKTPILHLLVYALERRLSGTFEFTLPDGASAATLLVADGCPAKVRTTEPIHFLGLVMTELGMITTDQLQQSLVGMQETPRLQGAILLEIGAVDQAKLDAGLRAQVERKVEHLFTLPAETTYAYYDGLDMLSKYGGAATPVDPFPVMWRGVSAAPVTEHVEATLRRIGTALVRAAATSELDRFGLGPAEIEVAKILRHKPSRVIDLASTAAGATTSQLLVYLLLITKQLELIDPAKAPPPSSGQAFARLQLQKTQKSPLVVEEQATFSAADDDRASTPGIRAPAAALADVRSPLSPPPPAPSTSIPPDNVDHATLRTKIVERAAQITSQNYFQMLALDRDASPETVQKAFIALAKTWHPDRLPAALKDVKDQCSKVFSHLTEAHATLMDPKRREEYLTLLKDGGATPDDQAKIQAILEAATEFQKAEILLKRSLADAKAHELLRRCVKLDPGQPDYVATLAWVEAHRPEGQTKEKTLEKIQMLDRCVAKKPQAERAYFYRAMLYKRLNDMPRALQDFKKVSELNPKNLDAVREVRLHKMRTGTGSLPPPAGPPSKPPPPSGGGLFGKLFKK